MEAKKREDSIEVESASNHMKDQNAFFLSQLYGHLLMRKIQDEEEELAALDRLSQTSRTSFFLELYDSEEHVTRRPHAWECSSSDMVKMAHQVFLSRPASSEEIAFHGSRLALGDTTREAFIASIATSGEASSVFDARQEEENRRRAERSPGPGGEEGHLLLQGEGSTDDLTLPPRPRRYRRTKQKIEEDEAFQMASFFEGSPLDRGREWARMTDNVCKFAFPIVHAVFTLLLLIPPLVSPVFT